jgi:drug/metabolite transporter (DMT)-like permease
MNKKIFTADGLLMVTALIWGSAFVAQRIGMNHVGPLTYNGFRFTLGALALLPLIHWRNGRSASGTMTLRHYFGGLLAGLILFIAATFQQVGLVYTTAGKAGFITGLYVIFVPLLGIFLGHRPDLGGWLGAVLAVIGMYFLSVTESLTLAPGDLWVLFGAIFWAVHLLILARLSPRMDTIKLACVQFFVCAFLSLVAGGATEPLAVENLIAASVPILYGGLLSVGVAYTLQVVAQKHAPPVHAAIILSLEAVFSAIAGWIILNEVLSARGLAGCALMLAGMLTAQLWPQHPQRFSESDRSLETV